MFRKILSYHKHPNELLLDAARNGNTDKVLFALQKRADINCSGFGGKTPLILAAIKGHLKAANLLINKGAEINDIDNNSSTALLNAVLYNQIEMVELLLHKGANADIRDSYNRTPLFIALISKHKNSSLITKMLLDCEVQYNYIETVKTAIKQNSVEKVKYLLEINIPKDRIFICKVIDDAIKIGNDQIINDILIYDRICHTCYNKNDYYNYYNREYYNNYVLPIHIFKIATNHFLNDQITSQTLKKLINFNCSEPALYGPPGRPKMGAQIRDYYSTCFLSLVKSTRPDTDTIIHLILSQTIESMNTLKPVAVEQLLSRCLYELAQLKPHPNHAPIAKILLDYGADPLKTFNKCTFWTDSAMTISKRNQNIQLKNTIHTYIRNMNKPAQEFVKSANEQGSAEESLLMKKIVKI